MAELFLSAFLDVLFDRLASRDLLCFVRQLLGGVDSEIITWERKFKMIQAVLTDAEEKQLTDKAVKMWLDDLQDLAYDAEDILDDFATKALEQKLMAQHNQGSSSQDLSFIPASLNPSVIMSNYSIASKIEGITSRLEQLRQEKVELGLQRIPGGTSSTAATQRRPPSSSVPTERSVFGRLQDKAKILDMVFTDTPSDHANIAVIPIVGMGGVGKTTLAREVYNDKAVEDSNFDVKAWVCVSDVFDVLGISKALVESITSAPCDFKSLNEVQVRLRQAVDGKRILLVLDDVWNEDYGLWEDLKAPFLSAAPSSKIIATTRHLHVALTMEPTQPYSLQRLSDEDCWSLFKMHALIESPAQFREKVVGKCGGLPLAAKTLGGLLRSKRHDEWDTILDSSILDLPQQNGILSVLRLSYHYLPSHLKRCFAYCAIFPKDYQFEKTELVFLWMAEGLIQQSEGNKQPEEWGRECFQDLLSRSIFEKSSGDTSKFVMHDLVHDLAQFVTGETIFKLEEANKSSRRFDRVRHFSYNRDEQLKLAIGDLKNKFEVLHKVEHLRTFLPVAIRGRYPGYITSMLLSELLPKFKKLRVLSLEGYQITELPCSIGDLKLLRYLNLARTAVISLPESTSSLMNLQILILRYCDRLTKLPAKMRKLINLRHLDIKGAKFLKEMPLGMKELKNLRKLSNFIVGKGGTISGLKDLKNLKFIGGEICISGLENVKNSNDAREATALQEKQNLEAVSLKWVSQLQIPRNEVEEEHVLDMLQPHKSIKVLSIENYVGTRFPQWIGDPSFSKMEDLTLENCENCTSLPSLGLMGSLKRLIIEGMKKIESIGSEICGKHCSKPFQSLETLCFTDLQEWKCWDINLKENGLVAGFSSLHELSIVDCPKLSGNLPEQLPSLETLVVKRCSELIVSFSSYPMLSKLEIDDCKGLVCSTLMDSNLTDSMTISNSFLEVYGRKGMMYDDGTAAKSRSVTITNFLELGKFLNQGFQQVETLWIGDFQQIKLWWDDMRSLDKKREQGMHVVLPFPGEVSIEEGCVSLVPFPEINFSPTNLRSLKMGQCRALKSLPEEIMGSNSKLESLYIRKCDSLTSIGRRKLPSSLKSLEIENCKMWRHFVDGEEDASLSSSYSSSVTLKYLKISGCPGLTSSSLGMIQSFEALEELKIWDCPKLESIPDGLENLKSIYLSGCPSIVSFLERGSSRLKTIYVLDCDKLEALPNDMHKLNSLEDLTILKCPSVVWFPEEGFPTNLTSLLIDNMKVYKAVIEWGLHRLTSLTYLDIRGCDDEEMEMMLPASLIDLRLLSWSKLRCLSSTCFQSLTSLQLLYIQDCPNLTSFPEEGLPSSLLRLHIRGCPKLKKECKRDKGKEWSKIAYIPKVVIDGKLIYEE